MASNSSSSDKFFERLKRNRLLRWLYQLSWAPRLYHMSLAFLGTLIYNFPSRKLFMIGVTGTKGKSTTTELIGFLLEKGGKKVAVNSSIRNEVSGITMPGRFALQRFLRQAVCDGCQYAVIEVTSQGVALNRHRFIRWGGVVFTNLAPEHIEAHGNFEAYREAKVNFFRYAAGQNHSTKTKIFVINKDDENAKYFIEATRGTACVKASAGREEIILYGKSELPSSLIGEFNKYNVGAAVAVARSQGIAEEIIKKAVIEFPGVPGRMEFVQKKPFVIVIDYALTPDSLRSVYQTLCGQMSKINGQMSKLIGVFGSAGGGRDKWKRPELGKIAAEYCDYIILTNDDPYDEEPSVILDDIEKGIFVKRMIDVGHRSVDNWQERKNYWKIVDRKEAIRKAIELANPGDIIAVTGKGSQQWLSVAGGKKLPWSDRQTVLDILNE